MLLYASQALRSYLDDLLRAVWSSTTPDRNGTWRVSRCINMSDWPHPISDGSWKYLTLFDMLFVSVMRLENSYPTQVNPQCLQRSRGTSHRMTKTPSLNSNHASLWRYQRSGCSELCVSKQRGRAYPILSVMYFSNGKWTFYIWQLFVCRRHLLLPPWSYVRA